MKCLSCKEEVSEKSHYALSQNVCPFCGKSILSEADHYFRSSVVKIMERHGMTEISLINDVTNDIINLLEGLSPEEAKEQGITLVQLTGGTDSPTQINIVSPDQSLQTVSAHLANVTTQAGIIQVPVNDKFLNRKPPKPVGLKTSSSSPTMPAPSESMDLSGIEDEVGAPTPEEAAEIQAMVDRGEIVFTSLH